MALGDTIGWGLFFLAIIFAGYVISLMHFAIVLLIKKAKIIKPDPDNHWRVYSIEDEA